MRKRVPQAVVALLAAACASSAFADGRVTITDCTLPDGNNVYNGTDGAGGAFVVTRATPGANGDYNGAYGGNLLANDGRGTGSDSFLSFCIEYQDHLSFNTTYYTQISDSAYDTSAPVNLPNPDPISGTTAKIYSEFRSIANGTASTVGLFNGLLGSSLSRAETTAIQQAIWYSEQEINFNDMSQLAKDIFNWAAANNDGGLHGVRVLRLWDTYNAQTGEYSGSHQDVLTCIPLPPSAYAGMSTFAGILGLAAIRRRKFAAQ
ncbi:MAG: hypothetical protein JSR77_11700 [Planctomycetes bacterium]|nr:hypothetical protein [Planctomycetota bacterium]